MSQVLNIPQIEFICQLHANIMKAIARHFKRKGNAYILITVCAVEFLKARGVICYLFLLFMKTFEYIAGNKLAFLISIYIVYV